MYTVCVNSFETGTGMRQDARAAREAEIAEAAYALLAEKGYGGMSMLAVAKRARASNETLYRWYGDKTGLFEALIARNVARVADHLDGALDGPPDLVQLGEALLSMLLSPEAIALNRAAAADASDALGAVLGQAGRGRLVPRLVAAFERMGRADPHGELALWIDVLVGDLQIRCATGAMQPPSADDIRDRAHRAARLLERLSPRSDS